MPELDEAFRAGLNAALTATFFAFSQTRISQLVDATLAFAMPLLNLGSAIIYHRSRTETLSTRNPVVEIG